MDENERKRIVQRGIRNVLDYKPSWRFVGHPKRSPWRVFKELLAGALVSFGFYAICVGDTGYLRWLLAGILFVTSCILVASRP
jgi:hypothetical protein